MNRYGAEKILKVTPLKKHAVWWIWTDVTIGEMKAMLDVLVKVALHTKSSIKY